jgi:hypothetical protein
LFTEKIRSSAKAKSLFQKISVISGEAVGIKAEMKFKDAQVASNNIKAIITSLAAKYRVLLLMDEVQTLAQHSTNANFVAALRTSLDLHKDAIKVIFTGSSQEGLRQMFSQDKAPFFHFGQNLPFPELDRGFVDHLVKMFEIITKRKLNAEILWSSFQEMQKIPHLARALVERLALNPNLNLIDAKNQLISEVFSDRAFANKWENCSPLQRFLLCEITAGTYTFFSSETRDRLAKLLGIKNLTVPSVQSAIRVLQRKGLIAKHPERGEYLIEDPNFKSWLLQQTYK